MRTQAAWSLKDDWQRSTGCVHVPGSDVCTEMPWRSLGSPRPGRELQCVCIQLICNEDGEEQVRENCFKTTPDSIVFFLDKDKYLIFGGR